MSDVPNRHEKDIKENKRFKNTLRKTRSQFSEHMARDPKLTHCNINRPCYRDEKNNSALSFRDVA